MKEPRRLRHESKSTIERMLLETASSYRRPATTRSKTLAALGLSGSALLSVGAARGAWAAFAAKVGGAKALVAIAALGAAVTVPAVYYGARHRTVPASEPAPSMEWHPANVAARSTARTSTESAPAVPVPEPATISGVSPFPAERSPLEAVRASRRSRVASNPARPARKDVPPVAASAPPPSDAYQLTAEVGAIEAARGRLAKGDATSALALLDDYAVTFPDGRLQPEAMVLRIDALAKTGRAGEARKVAEKFLQRYPKSVLAARVRGHMSD